MPWQFLLGFSQFHQLIHFQFGISWRLEDLLIIFNTIWWKTLFGDWCLCLSSSSFHHELLSTQNLMTYGSWNLLKIPKKFSVLKHPGVWEEVRIHLLRISEWVSFWKLSEFSAVRSSEFDFQISVMHKVFIWLTSGHYSFQSLISQRFCRKVPGSLCVMLQERALSCLKPPNFFCCYAFLV